MKKTIFTIVSILALSSCNSEVSKVEAPITDSIIVAVDSCVTVCDSTAVATGTIAE
jgi:hypothetical protein